MTWHRHKSVFFLPFSHRAFSHGMAGELSLQRGRSGGSVQEFLPGVYDLSSPWQARSVVSLTIRLYQPGCNERLTSGFR